MKDGEDLVLGADPVDDERGASSDQAPQDPGVLVGLPVALDDPGGQQLREGPRIAPVGLLLGLGDRREASRVDDQDLGDVWPDDPGDRQRVAGRLQRDPIIGAELPRELLQRARARR